MKKLYFTLLAISFFCFQVKAIEYIDICKSGNAGGNGYASTSKSYTNLRMPGLGGIILNVTITNINCSGEGYDQCPEMANNGQESGVDDIDRSYGNHLVEYANNALLNIPSGSHNLTIQVEGEQQPRLYRTTWNTLPSGEVVIKVFRDDI